MTAVGRAFGFLSQARWLNTQRARAYAWMLLVFMAVALGYDYLSMAIGHHPGGEILGPPGKPAATDFTAFWAAGHAVWAGHVADAYSLAALSATEHATAIMDKGALLAFFLSADLPASVLALRRAALSGGLLRLRLHSARGAGGGFAPHPQRLDAAGRPATRARLSRLADERGDRPDRILVGLLLRLGAAVAAGQAGSGRRLSGLPGDQAASGDHRPGRPGRRATLARAVRLRRHGILLDHPVLGAARHRRLARLPG